jgi:hypothetical protein
MLCPCLAISFEFDAIGLYFDDSGAVDLPVLFYDYAVDDGNRIIIRVNDSCNESQCRSRLRLS